MLDVATESDNLVKIICKVYNKLNNFSPIVAKLT